MDQEDQIDAILEGLHEEYKTVVEEIEGREVPPSITELHEKLLHHEAKLSSMAPAAILPVSANLVHQKGSHSHFNNNKNKSSNNYYNSQPNSSFNNNNMNSQQQQPRGQRPYLGKCQICGAQGHGSKKCPQLQS